MSNRISVDDLRQFAHLKQPEAAFQLGISTATLKRIIQDYGIRRWPYRRLAAIEAKKERLRKKLNLDPPYATSEFINHEISRLEEKRQLAIAQMGRNNSTAPAHLPSLDEVSQPVGIKDNTTLPSLQQLEEPRDSRYDVSPNYYSELEQEITRLFRLCSTRKSPHADDYRSI